MRYRVFAGTRFWIPFLSGLVGLGIAERCGVDRPRIDFDRADIQQPEWGVRIETANEMEAERARISAHLARIEKWLRAEEIEGLTPARRAARARHLDVLREYRERGVFPHNHEVSDHRTPVFVDVHGTPCAVGYLIARSGHPDLTERIARTRNLATVADLAEDPKLQLWLDEAGLSITDAAMIQPSYGPNPPLDEDNEAYQRTTVAGSAINTGFIVWNLLAGEGKRGWPGFLGLTAGVAQTAFGGVGLLDDRFMSDRKIEAPVIATNLVVGAFSSVFAVVTLRREANAAQRTGIAGAGDRPETRAVGFRDHSSSERLKPTTWTVTAWTPRGVDAGVRMDLRF